MDIERQPRSPLNTSLAYFWLSKKYLLPLILFPSMLFIVVYDANQTRHSPVQYLARNGFFGFSLEVQQFLQISNKSKVGFEPILLEPRLLEQILIEKERSLLLNRKLMPEFTEISSLEDSIQLISFGVFSQSLINHSEDTCNQWVGFKCETVYSQKRNESIPNRVASHFFLLKKKTLIHLVVLFKKRHFLRIEAVPQNKRKPFGVQIKDHLSFGSKEQAFDYFSIRQVMMPFAEAIVAVPDESDHFLAQMDSSEFIECTRPSDEDGEELPLLSLSPLALNAEEGLKQMKQMMKELKVPFWIASGTLLGWYRECGIIGHTTDVDFATWSEFATPNITALMKRFCPEPRLFQIFGVFEDGYEMSFSTRSHLKLDLFYIYKESNSTVKMASHILWNQTFANFYYPKFELCSGDLFGHKVSVPCNPEAVIEADYGPNWTVPAKDWSYYKSGFNMGPIKKWPHERVQHRYINCRQKNI